MRTICGLFAIWCAFVALTYPLAELSQPEIQFSEPDSAITTLEPPP